MKTSLTLKQEKFVDAYVLTGNVSEAARRAGYSAKTARVIGQETLLSPAVQAAVRARQVEYAQQLAVTKEDVIGGILAAISMAREQENPAAMIQGCSALARLCGFFEPVRVAAEATYEGAALQSRFLAMSDAELMALAGRSGAFS